MKYIYISRTTQRTNTGQVPACSQEPVDSTDANMVETSTCLETTQQEMTNFTVRLLIESDWSMFSCAPECSKQLPLPKYIANWEGLGVSPNVYVVFPPCLSVRIYLSSDNC